MNPLHAKENGGMPVLISIRGEQNDGGEDDVVEFVTAGSFSAVEKGFEICYTESELTGMEGTQTCLSVEGQRVTVVRTGQFSTQMIFEKGQKHLSLYETPAGAMLVGVSASLVDIALNEQGGSVFVDYVVEIDHALAGYNRFELTVSGTTAPPPPTTA